MPHGAPAPLLDWARWNGRKTRRSATSTSGRPPVWERYQTFIKANPHVLEEALHLARGKLAAGAKRIGAKALWEELRTSIRVKKLGSYKLDNDFTALLARDLIAAEPRLAGVIELRERKTRIDKAVDQTTPLKDDDMTKTVHTIQTEHAGSKDVIDVIDEMNGLWARVRVRETGLGKASIFLTPDELAAHGRACIALADDMKARR
jgi:hypothetical protein